MDDPTETPDELTEQFTIETEERATWALGRIAATSAAVTIAKATAADYVQTAEKEAARTADFFGAHLESYLQDNPPAKGKSTKLASGSIGYRTVKGGARITDQTALVEWAAGNDPTIINTTTTRSVAAADVKAIVSKTGEVPDGVTLTDDRENFYFKAKL